jgi:hypothetical protein
LLWCDCGHSWNSDQCIVLGRQGNAYTVAGTTWNCTEKQFANTSESGCVGIDMTDRVTAILKSFISRKSFLILLASFPFILSKLLLNRSVGFEDFGVPRTYTTISLLVAWIIVSLCVIRGVKTSGKVYPYLTIRCYNELFADRLCNSNFSLHCSSNTNHFRCNTG